MRHAFEEALDSLGGGAEEAPAPRRATVDLRASELDMRSRGGSHFLWEAAAAWAPEADPPPAPVRPRPPSAAPEDVARELALERLATLAQVAAARRRFCWDNHPDRRADLDRALANRRVAVANMLLDARAAALGRLSP